MRFDIHEHDGWTLNDRNDLHFRVCIPLRVNIILLMSQMTNVCRCSALTDDARQSNVLNKIVDLCSSCCSEASAMWPSVTVIQVTFKMFRFFCFFFNLKRIYIIL